MSVTLGHWIFPSVDVKSPDVSLVRQIVDDAIESQTNVAGLGSDGV